MPRRRPSYGSHGVAESNKRVGPPTERSPSFTTTRVRSNPSNAEQLLTSATIPNTAISKNKSATAFSSSSDPHSNMTRGQRLLRNRLGTCTTTSSSSSSKPPSKPARGRSHQLVEDEPVSEIMQQRNGKRFTFDGVLEDKDASEHNRRHRPGMPSPVPPPPPPVPNHTSASPPATRRPNRETPASSAPPAPPTQQRSRQEIKPESIKQKSRKIPFLKRHDAVKAPEEEISGKRRPPKPETAHARKTHKEKQQQKLLQQLAVVEGNEEPTPPQPASDVSVSSSVTDYRFQDQGVLQEKHTSHSRGNSSSSSVRSCKEKAFPSVGGTMDAPPQKSTSSGTQTLFWNNDASMNKSKGKNHKQPTKNASPNSCSITAATSGSRSQDDISQLTEPDISATPLTWQGVSSHAETEKIKNLSKHQPSEPRNRNSRPIPPKAPRSMSLSTHVPNTHIEDKRERYAVPSRDGAPAATVPPFHDDSSANQSFCARINPKIQRKTNRIKLHVYDLVQSDTQLDLFGCYFPLGQCFNGLNSTLHSMGTGAYHVGIEINGIEYAYGANSTNGLTGVFTCMPKHSPGYQYRQSIDFGNRLITRNDKQGAAGAGSQANASKQQQQSVPVDGRDIVRSMAYEYMGTEYDLLRKNCCTFAYDACLRLGVREDEIPSWFHNLAAAGAVTQDAAHSTLAPITQAFKGYVQENGAIEGEQRKTIGGSE